MELFGDFNRYLWGTFEFYMGLAIYLFALWIRIYVHYLAQYLYLLVRAVVVVFALCLCGATVQGWTVGLLKQFNAPVLWRVQRVRLCVDFCFFTLCTQSLNTPVFGFKLMVFQVVYKYMSGSISVAAETGVVAIGPIANLCVFLSFVALGSMFHKVRGNRYSGRSVWIG
jgi:hypothetical protein